MLIKHNTNTLLEGFQNDSKVCYLGIRCYGISQSLESIVDIFTYSYISICIYLNILKYQGNPNPRNLDTVLYTNSAIASAISISAITIMSKFNF